MTIQMINDRLKEIDSEIEDIESDISSLEQKQSRLESEKIKLSKSLGNGGVSEVRKIYDEFMELTVFSQMNTFEARNLLAEKYPDMATWCMDLNVIQGSNTIV